MKKVPREFLTISSYIHQDFDTASLTVDQLYGYLYGQMNELEVQTVKNFILTATTELSDNQLLKLWENSESDLLFNNGKQLRKFLSEIGNLTAKSSQ